MSSRATEERLDEVRTRVREYITTSYLSGEAAESLRDDEDLLLVLNSLQLLRMVIELEGTFGITIDNADMTPENLGTIERIACFVVGKNDG